MIPQPIQPIVTPAAKQYFGKYRGIVLNNIDPMQLGRIMPQVADIPVQFGWAMPCLPYVPKHGTLAIPPVGTNVWIEFEQGNVDYPIWSGCFWITGQPPLL